MCGLDRARKEIDVAPLMHPDGRSLLPQRRIGYDVLILSVGSRANDFGTTGVKELCWTIDSRAEADHFNRELRIRVLQSAAQGTDICGCVRAFDSTDEPPVFLHHPRRNRPWNLKR